MSRSGEAAKSIIVIIVFSIVSKFLGFIRESLIANKFGSGLVTDTFFIAISAISLFTTMITTSIKTTMIPVLSELEVKEGKEGKIRHTNNLLNIIFIISIALTILAWVLAPIIIRIVASGFKGEQLGLAVSLMKIGTPTIILASIRGVFRGYLQSEMMFTESAAEKFPYSFVYIIFLLFLANLFGIRALMVVSVLAEASQVIIQIPSLRKSGFRYSMEVNIKDIYVKKMIYLIPPVLVSATVSDLNSIIDKSMASNLTEGSISALHYAYRLNYLVQGTFISGISTVYYPMLSEDANSNNFHGLKKTIIYGINIVMLITIPAALGMILLAKPIVKIVFERGEFDAVATYMTAGALIFYSIGLVASSIKTLVNKVYYSIQDTKTPMNNSFIELGINIVLNIVFIKYMGHRGLALATSTSAIVTLFNLLYKLKLRIGSFGLMRSVKCGLKSLIASIPMGVVVYFIYKTINLGTGSFSELITLVISVVVGALIYFIFIYLLKVEELDLLIKAVKGKFKKSS